jgi:hypothetical protein
MLFTTEVEDIIKENAASDVNAPLFVYLACVVLS